MQNNKLETGTGAQILGSSGGIRNIQPVLPRGGGGCPLIQLTEASERRRSTDEIPVSRRSQEGRQRKKPIAYSRRDLGAAKYPPGAQRVGVRTSEPTSSIALLGHRREQEWSRRHESKTTPLRQHTPLQSDSFTSV